jgi:hypothetical protein
MDAHQFPQLPIAEIRILQRELGRPLKGVFVLDGSCRLVLAQTGFEPPAYDFFASATLPAKLVLHSKITCCWQGRLPVLPRILPSSGVEPQLFKSRSALTAVIIYCQAYKRSKTKLWESVSMREGFRLWVNTKLNAWEKVIGFPVLIPVTRIPEERDSNRIY